MKIIDHNPKIFSALIFHNSQHCGQISSAIAKGKSIERNRRKVNHKRSL